MTAPTLTMPAPAANAAAALGRPLSPSQVNTFLDCQARWYYGSVAGLPDPPTGNLALGKAIHYTIAVCLRLRAQGEHPIHADLAELLAHTLTTELASAELRADEDRGALLNDGLAMLAMWSGQIAPAIEPAAVEIQVHGQIGHQHVRGIVDVIDQAGTVIDWKTAAKKPGAISQAHALQLTTYGMLAGKRECRLVTLARTKTPSWCQHSLTLTPNHTQYAATLYDMAAEAMQTGLYLPNRGSMLCSRKHCAFWRECQAEYGGSVE